MRDEYRVRALGNIDRIVIRKPEQNRENANVHVREVAHSLANHRLRMPGEMLAPFDHHQIERFLCSDLLVNEHLDTLQQLGIRKNRDLNVEDRCLFRTGVFLRARLHLCESRFRLLDGFVKSLDLGFDARHRYLDQRNVRHFPQQQVHWPDHDAR